MPRRVVALLLLAVGMSGQTNSGAISKDACHTYPAGTAVTRVPRVELLLPPAPHEGDCFKLRSGMLEKIGCPSFTMGGTVQGGPMDVPAVQEKGTWSDWTQIEHKYTYWTCTDPSRALMESVDGKSHWCHRGVL